MRWLTVPVETSPPSIHPVRARSMVEPSMRGVLRRVRAVCAIPEILGVLWAWSQSPAGTKRAGDNNHPAGRIRWRADVSSQNDVAPGFPRLTSRVGDFSCGTGHTLEIHS